MKKLLAAFAVLITVLSGITFWLYNAAQNRPMPQFYITAGDIKILPQKSVWHSDVFAALPQFMHNKWVLTQNVQIENEDTVTIDLDGTHLALQADYPYSCSVINSQGTEILSGQENGINFDQRGKYQIAVTQQIPYSNQLKGFGKAEFAFYVNVNPTPRIEFDKDNIKQGDLVKVNIKNLMPQDTIEINSDFAPSAVEKTDTAAAFYIPITYYKPAGIYNLSIAVNGEETRFEYAVTEKQFTEIHFTVSEEVTSSTVNSAAANSEYRQKIHSLYYTKQPVKYWRGAFVKPVQESRISSEFGQKRYVNNSKTPTRHSGIDYAAPLGTPVYAPADGFVEFADFLQLSGNTVVIDHGLGLKSYYFHMDSLTVSPNTMVKQRQQLGTVGTTGYSTGPHLHFQISIENQPIDPQFMYDFEE